MHNSTTKAKYIKKLYPPFYQRNLDYLLKHKNKLQRYLLVTTFVLALRHKVLFNDTVFV
jgi:hypothetical protein